MISVQNPKLINSETFTAFILLYIAVSRHNVSVVNAVRIIKLAAHSP